MYVFLSHMACSSIRWFSCWKMHWHLSCLYFFHRVNLTKIDANARMGIQNCDLNKVLFEVIYGRSEKYSFNILLLQLHWRYTFLKWDAEKLTVLSTEICQFAHYNYRYITLFLCKLHKWMLLNFLIYLYIYNENAWERFRR